MTQILRLEHSIRAPGEARHWIVQRCHDWHCDALADAAALMTSELVTNVFLHARTDCLIKAGFDHPVLTVTVTDADSQDVVLQPPSNTAEEGRGLAIVAALADTWGIRRKHDGHEKSVWFSLSESREDQIG